MSLRSRGNFLEALGSLTCSASLLDYILKELLITLIGDEVSRILVADMAAGQVEQKIIDIIKNGSDKNLSDLINQGIKFCKIIRIYRNYYVHGIQDFFPKENPKEGYIITHSVKGGDLQEFMEKIETEKLYEVVAWFEECSKYLSRIRIHLESRKISTLQTNFFQLPPAPTLPPALKKKSKRLPTRSWAVGNVEVPKFDIQIPDPPPKP